MTTCPVLEELGIGRCMNESTTVVWAPDDSADASLLSCAEHVPLARKWVRGRMLRDGAIVETTWPDRTPVTAKPVIA